MLRMGRLRRRTLTSCAVHPDLGSKKCTWAPALTSLPCPALCAQGVAGVGRVAAGGGARVAMVAGTAVDTKEYVAQLRGAKEAVRELITSKKSNPILVSNAPGQRPQPQSAQWALDESGVDLVTGVKGQFKGSVYPALARSPLPGQWATHLHENQGVCNISSHASFHR